MKYKKTDGFATIHGQMFEVKLAALLFLRATDRALDFQLAVNVDGAGALDDIVLRYKIMTSDGITFEWHTSFIQLKHKEWTSVKLEMFTAPGGNFSLKKYLHSYMKIKTFVLSDKNQEIFSGPLHNCHLAIYTNAKPDSKLKNRPFVRDAEDLGGFESFIKSGLETEMIFSFNSEQDEDVVSSLSGAEDVSVEDVHEFLSKLKVFCGQPSEPDLDALLNAEMSSILSRSQLLSGRQVLNEDVIDIVDKLVQEFHKWWSIKKNANLLDQKSNVINQILVQFLSTEAKKSQRMNVQFNQSSIDIVKTHLASTESFLSVITDRDSIKLSCTKMLQAFEADENSSGKSTSCIFLALERFLVEPSVVTSVWCQEDKHCLCLVNTTLEFPPNLCYEKICDVLLRNPLKKCVILSAQSDAIAASICTILGDKFKEIVDNVYLSQLNDDFKNLFSKRKLDSQGYSTKLSQFIGADDHPPIPIDDDMVDVVLSGEKITIGQNLNDIVGEVTFYISRTLQRDDVVDEDFLATQTSGSILVTGLTAERLDTIVAREASNEDDDLREVEKCNFKTLLSKPIQDELDTLCHIDRFAHWFHMNVNNKLQWIWSLRGIPPEEQVTQTSTSASTNLFRYHLQAGQYATESGSAMDMAGRVVLVVAEPGMGKTTLLNHLALQAKNDHPDLWVIRINLNDHTKLFSEMNTRKISAIDFLMSAVGVNGKSTLEKTLFRICFESSGNVVVFLDGFDEIAPSFCDEGCTLITSLLETKVKKVWITSRHSMREKLEKHLSTIAFHLLPFSEKDQRTFITTYWKKLNNSNGHDLSDADLDARITQFLEAVTVSMNDEEMQFMGIPLQTMMLAEIFDDHALDQTNCTVPEKLNLLDLFEKFVEKKLAVFSNKIFASNATNNEGAMEDIRRVFVKNHMHASLFLLLTDADFDVLQSKDKIMKKAKKFLQKIQDGKDKTGIIHNVRNGQPHFVHRTFAEYFAALWLSKHFEKARELINARLFETNFQVVRNMFDRILAKGCELHNAVLSSDTLQVEALISDGIDINSTDKGGRSALHLAAAIGFNADMDGLITTEVNIIKEKYRKHEGPRPEHLVECLLRHEADVSILDKVLRLSPLQFALKTESWDAVEMLLQVDKNVGAVMQNAVQALLSSVAKDSSELILDDKISKLFIMLIVVSAHGFIDCIVILLDMGIPVDFLIPYDPTSMITIAATFGHIELVKLLINRGSNFTKYISGTNTFPLHKACERGHTAVVKTLVDSIADGVQRLEFINKNDFWGHTAMYHVAVGGRTAILRYLITQGVDITSRLQSRDPGSPLHTAGGFYGQLPIVEMLIESFGDDLDAKLQYINTSDNVGRTALFIAATYGHAHIVDYLISHGSTVNAVQLGFADTALHKACEKGHLAVVKSLVRSFGNDTEAKISFINSFNRMKKTPIYVAAEKDFFSVVEFLFNEGGDLYNACEYDSALIVACKEGRTSVVNVLMKVLGGDEVARREYINSCNSSGHSSVFIAAYHKHLHIADFLIRKGGDPTEKENAVTQEALHEACSEGDFTIVKEIVENFGENRDAMLANINSVNPIIWWSPLTLACRKGFPDIAEYLISKGCDVQPTTRDSYLHTACSKGLLSVATALINRFADDAESKRRFVQHIDCYGESVLHDALEHEEIVKFLISEGAELTIHDSRTMYSPLHKACKNGHLPAVKGLLESFGEETEAMVDYINHLNINGHTALYDAASNDHPEIIEYLINKGGEITKYNPGSKKTALHEACFKGHLSVILAIVNSFGNNDKARMTFTNTLDFCGECALYTAASKGHAEIVELLAKQYRDVSEAPINVATKHSALHEACDEGCLSVVEVMVNSFGEDRKAAKSSYINSLNKRGFSAVYIAAYKERNDISELLVHHGGDVSAQVRGAEDIAFHDACGSGYVSKVQEHLDRFGEDNGGKVAFLNSYNIYDCSDMPTALHLASWSGHADIVSLLLTHGCNIRSRRSGDRLHSMHRACEKGHLTVVRSIIESFGDDCTAKIEFINSFDEYERSAMFIAAYSRDAHLTEYLISQGGDPKICDKAMKQVTLQEAAYIGSLSKVKEVLDSVRADPQLKLEILDGCDSRGNTALMLAAKKGHPQVVRFLADQGSDLLRRERFDKATVMHEAIEWGHLDAVKAVIDGFGNDHETITKLINRLDRHGQSELYFACKKAFAAVVALLRAHGGDVNKY